MSPLFPLLLLLFSSSLADLPHVTLSAPTTKLTVNQISPLNFRLREVQYTDVVLRCTMSNTGIISLVGREGTNVTIRAGENHTTVQMQAGSKGGSLYLSTVILVPDSNSTIPDLDVSVMHSSGVDLLCDVLGWICFAVWSVSFYPQVLKNWQRKSVVGLSFDFLGYNLLGWICYSAFNFTLLWVDEIRHEYHQVYPHGVINVQLSDFCFSFHALVITTLTILQCMCYERAGQTPSGLCRAIIALFLCGMVMLLIVTASCCMTWFQYVSVFSYVKLAVTLFKYSPQVYLNFKKKSTEAVSIYQYLLDGGGGAISLIQMGLIAYNFDDWKTFLGDFTKFGLATLSILYDLIFVVQHYILYRNIPYTALSTIEDDEPALGSSVQHKR